MKRHLTSQPCGPQLAAPAAIALIVVGVVHLLDGPGSLQDHLYLGLLELGLAAASLPLAVLLVSAPARALWDTALALNLAAMILFLASRTVGLPGSTDDIGNWTQLLGLVNLAAESAVILLAVAALRPRSGQAATRSIASR